MVKHNKYKWYRIAAIAGGLLVAMFLAACAVAATTQAPASAKATPSIQPPSRLNCTLKEDPIPLRINLGQAAAYAPIMVALDKGYYKQAGLKIETANITTGPEVISAIIGGSLDAGGTNALSLYPAITQGAPLKAVTTYAGGGDRYAVVASKKSGITRVADIVNKRVGVEQGSGSQQIYEGMLNTEGISPNSVQMVPLKTTDMAAALGIGQVDAVIPYEPFISTIEAQGTGVVVARGEKYLGGAWAVIVFHSNYVRDCPEGARRFVLAHFQAMQYLRRNPSESVDIVHKYLTSAKPGVIAVILKYFNFDPRLTQAQLESMRQDGAYLLRLGKIKEAPNYSKVFDTSFTRMVANGRPDLVRDLK